MAAAFIPSVDHDVVHIGSMPVLGPERVVGNKSATIGDFASVLAHDLVAPAYALVAANEAFRMTENVLIFESAVSFARHSVRPDSDALAHFVVAIT